MLTNQPPVLRDIITEEKSPMLPFEHAMLSGELQDLGVAQSALSRLLGEAMQQSSETWHDNAPADAINHEGRMLSARAEQLIATLGKAVIVGYPEVDDERIILGTIVGIKYQGDDEIEHLLLTGVTRNAPHFSTEADIPRPLQIVTAQSPLGSAILGRKPGDTPQYEVRDRMLRIAIDSVQQLKATDIVE